jgi:hypothetical protein
MVLNVVFWWHKLVQIFLEIVWNAKVQALRIDWSRRIILYNLSKYRFTRVQIKFYWSTNFWIPELFQIMEVILSDNFDFCNDNSLTTLRSELFRGPSLSNFKIRQFRFEIDYISNSGNNEMISQHVILNLIKCTSEEA